MNIPFVNLKKQYDYCKHDIDTAIASTIERSSFITGPDVINFEETIAAWVESESCASTGSGTTALLCALKAIGIDQGDEVITTPHTFVATTESIINAGATPIFVDVDPVTGLIDTDKIDEKITPKTKAILFVDIYGQCPDIAKIRKICDVNNLYMIEDAAQSFGNMYDGKTVGSLSDLTCFSFNPVKNLGAMGDAGCVTGRGDLVQKVKEYRDHGRTSRYQIEKIGYNARIDNLQANIVLAKLSYINDWLDEKRRICNYYNDNLKNYVEVLDLEEKNTHSYYVYVIKSKNRDKLKSILNDYGIQTNIHYAVPCNKHPAFKEYHTKCEMAESLCDEILSLPCWAGLSDNEIEYIIDCTKKASIQCG